MGGCVWLMDESDEDRRCAAPVAAVTVLVLSHPLIISSLKLSRSPTTALMGICHMSDCCPGPGPGNKDWKIEDVTYRTPTSSLLSLRPFIQSSVHPPTDRPTHPSITDSSDLSVHSVGGFNDGWSEAKIVSVSSLSCSIYSWRCVFMTCDEDVRPRWVGSNFNVSTCDSQEQTKCQSQQIFVSGLMVTPERIVVRIQVGTGLDEDHRSRIQSLLNRSDLGFFGFRSHLAR